MIWLSDQGLKRNDWKTADKKVWGLGMWRDLSENAYQRVTSAEKDFSNQMDRMTHSVDTSQPLSMATPVSPVGS